MITTCNTLAVDLGAGNGLQSISLAKLGFKVIAVDFNQLLLDELAASRKELPIMVAHDDAISFLNTFNQKAAVIVCMGDTITHFESLGHVEKLVEMVSLHLESNGKIVISFRELAEELKGAQRFIPVRNDETRILTCFLEYFPDHVIVHDILHERTSGKWVQRVSSYPKLRLSEMVLTGILERYNIRVYSTERISGMLYVSGQKIN